MACFVTGGKKAHPPAVFIPFYRLQNIGLIKNYGAKIQASITYVDGSLGVNHDYDTSTDTVFTDEILFRLITTISF